MNSHLAVERSARTFLSSFRDQVDRRPAAPAVTQGAATLSYSQLDRKSNALAKYLQAVGSRPDALVGLMLNRSPEMVVSVLAILKAGAAYLPLDPAFPADRLAFMVDDAAPVAVVTDGTLAPRLPPRLRLICLDSDAPAIDAEGDSATDLTVAPSHLAYVIYTSGSTGQPKGAEIEHRSVGNLMESFAAGPRLRDTDTVLAHASLSFDFSVTEAWLPLSFGAHIVLADGGPAVDARAIVAQLASRKITFLQGTPSLWRLLLDAGWKNGRGMTAISGGEPLPRDLANAILSTGAQLWNVYGPTETTVWVTVARVDPEGPIVIGHPIRETAIHVLDGDLQPVPEGEIGELCVSGSGVGRGYRNREALTSEKFLFHPLARQPDGRLYRTGDLGRSLGARGFECLGRTDHQIKIDGFRVEPGEVEAALALHSAVRLAIACAVEPAPGDKRLVAYVVHDPSAPPQVDDLLALARAKLPAHMVPAAFVLLTEAPLTATGKLDRRALPAPDWHAPGKGAAPATPLEQQLAAIWTDVLGSRDIGVDDNFFDIGGRSRLGAQVFGRIETDLGKRLPLAMLFEHPTIRGLARAIEASSGAPSRWRSLVPIQARGSRVPLFFVHPVGGNVLAYRDLIRRLGTDVPCYGLQAIGLDGVATPLTSVEEMAQRYLEEVRSVQARGPYQLCGFSFGGLVAFEMALVLRAQAEDVRLLALLDTDFPDYPSLPPFRALARWPFFRSRIFPTLQRVRRHLRTLRRLGPGGYVDATVRQRAAAATTDDPFWAVAERVRKANTHASIHYVPRYYDGAVTYFRAVHENVTRDSRPRWRSMARRAEFIDVAGGHSDLRQEPQVQIVAEAILERMEMLDGDSRVA